jgi:hypothetical protein
MSNNQNSKWDRRDSKRRTKKGFVSDNRRSVRWMFKVMLEKAKRLRSKDARQEN